MNHFIYAVSYVSLKLMTKQKSRVDALKKKKKKKKKKERGKKHSCRESHQFTNVGRNRKAIEIQNKQKTVNPYIAITTLNVNINR